MYDGTPHVCLSLLNTPLQLGEGGYAFVYLVREVTSDGGSAACSSQVLTGRTHSGTESGLFAVKRVSCCPCLGTQNCGRRLDTDAHLVSNNWSLKGGGSTGDLYTFYLVHCARRTYMLVYMMQAVDLQHVSDHPWASSAMPFPTLDCCFCLKWHFPIMFNISATTTYAIRHAGLLISLDHGSHLSHNKIYDPASAGMPACLSATV